MTYVETSAVVGILLREPDSWILAERLLSAPEPTTSVVSKVEMALAIGREIGDYQKAGEIVSAFLAQANVKVLPVGEEIYGDVLRAYARFGKGTGHRASLNFGDCFSYAIAKANNMPMIYKGNDFSQTDVATG